MEEYRASSKTVEMFNKEAEMIRTMDLADLERNTENIDWDSLAKNHVPSRSGVDCQIQWLQHNHPDINKSKWTRNEDKRLLALAKKHKAHNWEAIAKELDSNRTPAACFQRYQRSLNTNMMKSKWSKEEDKSLVNAVRRYGEKNWQQVATALEGRTGQQCLHRWQKSLNPNIHARGRWSPEEDMRLTFAVKAYGSKSWTKISKHVPGRTDVQCRERWVNILNPDLNNGPWTEQEDEKLKSAIKKYGVGKWAQIAQLLYPRTDNQCWRRWKKLHVDDVEMYRRSVKRRRTGLVNNFVGREKERPDLEEEDFVEVLADTTPNPGSATEKAPKTAKAAKSTTTSTATKTKSTTTTTTAPTAPTTPSPKQSTTPIATAPTVVQPPQSTSTMQVRVVGSLASRKRKRPPPRETVLGRFKFKKDF
eukprot:TRINITY_DN12636_c0_g1_i1.p1 TRINITY_DN12636_c0_g1~~TRINITY_DN12636_c0_g1_i1.p1  ORF type:complete len:452 (+),score=89.12 TRINITY_DN12636_c0_g1_i1:101-1357(+)